MDHETVASAVHGPHSPESRRVVFDMRVLVHGCANIPYHANARVHCKWKLPGTATASRSGFLPFVDTTSTHLAAWDTTIELPGCVFRVDNNSMQLKPSVLRLSVRQESRFVLQGFARLGIVQIDLADFAGQAATDRTYLLGNARLNSTLSVTVFGEQVSGDVMFRRRGSVGDGGVPVEDSRLLRGRTKLDTRATNHNTVSSAHSPQRAAHDNSIYQVVGDILRISEENRLSRNPSQVDTFEK